MGDRHPGFPMHPQGFNPAGFTNPQAIHQAMLHQAPQPHTAQQPHHQQQQQQQPTGQTDASGPNGMLGGDMRMWAMNPQQLAQLQHMRQQHPSHPGDMVVNQPPQMGEFGRAPGSGIPGSLQNMQGQQQGQGHLGQLQFGLSSAHSATPDPSSSHHLSQNGLQPSLGGLGGMPFGANNAATLQAAFRNPAMMNQYQNGTIARQLDRLNAATQQNTTLGALNQRPSMLQRPLQGMPGGSHLIGGPGPAPPNHMLPTAPGDNTPLPANVPDILLRFQYPQITSQSAGGPPLPPWPPRTSKDLRDWGARLKNEVMHLESQASSLSANRNGINDLETEQAVNGLRNKAQNFKVLFQMIVKMLNSIQHHASSGSVNPQNGFGSGGTSLPQAQTQQPMHANTNTWSQPPQNAPAQQFPNAQPNVGMQFPSSMTPGNNNMSLNGPEGTPGMQHRTPSLQSLPSTLPPTNRPGPSPAPSATPGPSQQPMQTMQSASKPLELPPLSQVGFQQTYRGFCVAQHLNHDERTMTVGDRRIDLYKLHCEVIKLGGCDWVTKNELWPVVGAKMDFVQFPATAMMPPTSGPGHAQALAHIYRQYLHAFEGLYANGIRQRQEAARAMGAQGQENGQGQPQRVALDEQQIAKLSRWANTSAEQLRAQGVNEAFIQEIERHRPQMMNWAATGKGPVGASQPAPSLQPAVGGAMSGHGRMPSNGGPNDIGVGLDAPFGNPAPSFPANGPLPGLQRQELLNLHRQYQSDSHNASVRNDLTKLPPHQCDENQRREIYHVVERCIRFLDLMEPRMPIWMLRARKTPEFPSIYAKFVQFASVVRQQKQLLATIEPKLVLKLEMLHSIEGFFNQFRTAHLQDPMGQPGQSGQPSQPGGVSAPLAASPPHAFSPAPPPHSKPPPVAFPQQHQPPPHSLPGPSSSSSAASRPIAHSRVPSSSNMGSSPASTSVPTPAASVRTPTPANTSSPQSVKSPKPRPKPKPTPRTNAASRKLSAKQTAVEQSSGPAVPVPSSAAPSDPFSGKRPREEDAMPTGPTPAPEVPSPKRVKSEWEGPPSGNDQMAVRDAQFAAVKTSEDALAILEKITADLTQAIAEGGAAGAALGADVEASLAQVRGATGSGLDTFDDFSRFLASTNVKADAVNSSDGFEFFDFSSFGKADDEDKVAAVPELVPSSSTNPSPQSDSTFGDTPKLAARAKASTEPTIVPMAALLDTDPYRLGVWGEIDGGESAYFQPNDGWKWAGEMPHSDWAIVQPNEA